MITPDFAQCQPQVDALSISNLTQCLWIGSLSTPGHCDGENDHHKLQHIWPMDSFQPSASCQAGEWEGNCLRDRSWSRMHCGNPNRWGPLWAQHDRICWMPETKHREHHFPPRVYVTCKNALERRQSYQEIILQKLMRVHVTRGAYKKQHYSDKNTRDYHKNRYMLA